MCTVIKWNDVAFNFLEPSNVFFSSSSLSLSVSLLSFACGSCIKYVRTRTCKQLYNGISTENGQRNTRVTFIMTGQISKHEHITTKCTNERMTRENRKKKKMRSNWNESDGRKGTKFRAHANGKWLLTVANGQCCWWGQIKDFVLIWLVDGSAPKGEPSNICIFYDFMYFYYYVSCCCSTVSKICGCSTHT